MTPTTDPREEAVAKAREALDALGCHCTESECLLSPYDISRKSRCGRHKARLAFVGLAALSTSPYVRPAAEIQAEIERARLQARGWDFDALYRRPHIRHHPAHPGATLMTLLMHRLFICWWRGCGGHVDRDDEGKICWRCATCGVKR